MKPEDKSQVLIVAAEDSSVLYAQRILEAWKSQGNEVHSFGVGSKAMEEKGFEIVGRSEEMAVVGLQEVLSHYSEIKDCFDRLVALAAERRPKFALLLDYPGFNLRIAKKLKALDIPVIYYISPQVWAWHTSRVHKIKQLVDKMLVLFPFEQDFYKKHGIDVTFVGHPLLDELEDKYFEQDYKVERRNRYGVGREDFLLGLMPGSRKSELKHHLEVQLAVAERIHKKNPQVKIALLVAPGIDLDQLRNQLPDYKFPLILLKDEPLEMVNMCDLVLCASGTATLIVGLLEVPLVIMYKMNTFTAWLAKIFVKSTPYFGLINLVLGKMVAPEFFQERASEEKLFESLDELIYNKEQRQNMVSDLKEARHRLGDKGVTQRVVKNLEVYF